MKQLLNTLFIVTPGSWLHKEGETIRVMLDGQERLRVPIHTVGGVVLLGLSSMSAECMAMCARQGVAVSFLTDTGRFQARVEGETSGNVLLRREQYRRADDLERSADVARSILMAKIGNCRAALQRFQRNNPNAAGTEQVQAASARLQCLLQDIRQPRSLDSLRGLEGEAAATYFGVFNVLILHPSTAFVFSGRTRRPPLDPVNALLSFYYTLLTHDVRAACSAVGLDAQVGFLHRDRPGRPGLALDLMEELRPYLADRLVLTLINRKQIRPEDFRREESGAVLLKDEPRKEVIRAWQERKRDEVVHPFLEEKMPVGMLPFAQALLLARHLRGEMEAYAPFLWR